jgi:hypothetical protein
VRSDANYQSTIVNIGGEADSGKQFEATSVSILGQDVNVSHASGGNYLIRAASNTGSCSVSVTDSIFSRLTVGFFGSDDELSVQNTSTTADTEFDGGGGTDTYTNGGGNSLASLTVKNFEIFE